VSKPIALTRLAVSMALVTVALGAGPGAPAAKAHGAKAETYTAEAPVPDPRLFNCSEGTEGESKESHSFSRIVAGTLSVTMTDFTGDWDIYLYDKRGIIIGESSTGQPIDDESSVDQPTNPQVESFSTLLRANQIVTIVACNWAGGPTATVSFTFRRS